MAGECIVKVPKYSVYDDYDFIGFSFNGYHCVEDLNIIRVNGGSMYSENLTPQIQEKSGQHPGVEGAYLLDVQHRQKVFDVNIAFDSLTDEQLYKLKEVFAGKEMGELWFDEYPYKVWDAKVTGQPMLKVIPFGDDGGPTIYKGEGTIQFTAYYPYAHTPDYVQWDDNETEAEWKERDGKILSSYECFHNVKQWAIGERMPESEMDTTFEIVVNTSSMIPEVKDGLMTGWLYYEVPNYFGKSLIIKIQHPTEDHYDVIWNSRTGLVCRKIDENNLEVINHCGRSFGQVPIISLNNLSTTTATEVQLLKSYSFEVAITESTISPITFTAHTFPVLDLTKDERELTFQLKISDPSTVEEPTITKATTVYVGYLDRDDDQDDPSQQRYCTRSYTIKSSSANFTINNMEKNLSAQWKAIQKDVALGFIFSPIEDWMRNKTFTFSNITLTDTYNTTPKKVSYHFWYY